MLFLVISTPRPERPSSVAATRLKFWKWIDPKMKSKQCKMFHARTGRGAVALFDVKSHEELHEVLTEWSEMIPTHFDLYPLIDSGAAQKYLKKQAS